MGHKYEWWKILYTLPEYKNTFNLWIFFYQHQIFFAHAWLGSVTLNFRTEPCIKGVNGSSVFPWRLIFCAKASHTFFTAICLFHHFKNWAGSQDANFQNLMLVILVKSILHPILISFRNPKSNFHNVLCISC